MQPLTAHLMAGVHARLGREHGATAVEYGVMLAAIAGVIIAIVFAIGTKVGAGLTDFNASF